MKINILTSGRFHVMDLARELEKYGHDIKFYSYVPPKRIESFGLKSTSIVPLLYPLLPFLFLKKIFPQSLFIAQLSIKALDNFTSLFLRKTDITFAMSGLFVTSLEKSKKQNSVIIVERGSKHILDQKEILESIPSLKDTIPVSHFDLTRELHTYKLADYVGVATTHVQDTFIKRGFDQKKILVNPYGVDLSSFYEKENVEKKFDLIFVGNWSYQKGCDLLLESARTLNLSLLHVGSLGDMDFPQDETFTHVNPVDQKKLVDYYNRAKIFVLPSRQEGLAMVQMQALACGLPIVFSEHTGGRDISLFSNSEEWLFETEEENVSSLNKTILKALNFAKVNHTKPDFSEMTWEAYGKRYEKILVDIKNKR